MLNNKNKGNNKKPKINFYWIYAVIVVLVIIIQLFSWPAGTLSCSETEFEQFLANKKFRQNNSSPQFLLDQKKLTESFFGQKNVQPSICSTENIFH